MAKSEDVSLVKMAKISMWWLMASRLPGGAIRERHKAGTWVSLEPGREVFGGPDSFSIKYNRVSVQ